MPEFMGKRYGDSTQDILAGYALIKILISWLSLGLFSGGILVRQILGIPMWQSTIVLVAFAGLFTLHAGGLKAIAKVNVFQMILLIVVSFALTFIGFQKLGGITALLDQKAPDHFWNLDQSSIRSRLSLACVVAGLSCIGCCIFLYRSEYGAKCFRCKKFKTRTAWRQLHWLVKSIGIAHVHTAGHFVFCLVP